jgi:hypothetical protein
MVVQVAVGAVATVQVAVVAVAASAVAVAAPVEAHLSSTSMSFSSSHRRRLLALRNRLVEAGEARKQEHHASSNKHVVSILDRLLLQKTELNCSRKNPFVPSMYTLA